MSYYPGLIESLVTKNSSKIVFFIMDGLGGLPIDDRGTTELEAANTPHLDNLARHSSCGLLVPVAAGVTPGSGPGHFALFGYDPVENNVGRGVLEAAGIGFPLTDRDVAVRGNFATVDAGGNLVDRRAGRLPTEENQRICKKLRENIKIPGVELFVETVKEHRLLVVFRGDDLSGDLADTDPQKTGVPPLPARALTPEAEKTAKIVQSFLDQAARVLADEPQANMLTLRGFAKHKPYPSLEERFGLRALCLANYPMYRGVAFLVGMEIHPVLPDVPAQIAVMKEKWEDYDFFFLHAKTTDKTGEDGDFEAKVKAIEELDRLIPSLVDARPDVLVITGDHSTPSALRSHSWHPVPVLLHSRYSRIGGAAGFNETECARGVLGRFPARDLMPLALAHAGRLQKFGA
ncbi:MAG: 2,3-bisphosphoglycerate-independent phosphoglycerate mutase [Acidobacteriota bacterium]